MTYPFCLVLCGHRRGVSSLHFLASLLRLCALPPLLLPPPPVLAAPPSRLALRLLRRAPVAAALRFAGLVKAGPRRRGATLKLIASACPVNKMTALPCASSANARLCASRSVWLALQAMGCGRSFSSFLFYILGNFQRYTGATDDALYRCLGTPTRPAASRITACLAMYKPSVNIAPPPVPDPGFSPRRRGCLWSLGRVSLRTPTLPSSFSSAALAPR